MVERNREMIGNAGRRWHRGWWCTLPSQQHQQQQQHQRGVCCHDNTDGLGGDLDWPSLDPVPHLCQYVVATLIIIIRRRLINMGSTGTVRVSHNDWTFKFTSSLVLLLNVRGSYITV